MRKLGAARGGRLERTSPDGEPTSTFLDVARPRRAALAGGSVPEVIRF